MLVSNLKFLSLNLAEALGIGLGKILFLHF